MEPYLQTIPAELLSTSIPLRDSGTSQGACAIVALHHVFGGGIPVT